MRSSAGAVRVLAEAKSLFFNKSEEVVHARSMSRGVNMGKDCVGASIGDVAAQVAAVDDGCLCGDCREGVLAAH